MKKLKAQRGYVIVEPQPKVEEGEQRTESGLILSEDVAERLKDEATHLEHKVVSGPEESGIQPGDRAITSFRALQIPITVDGRDVVVINEIDIVALVSSEEES